MKKIALILTILLLNMNDALAKDCNNAFQKVMTDGPMDQEETSTQMRCEVEVPLSRRKFQKYYVCVFVGTPKHSLKDQYGTGDLVVISAEDPKTEIEYKEILGEWFPYKGALRKSGFGVEEVMVNTGAVGAKVLRKTAKDDTASLMTIEKITLSLPEKNLRYEKSLKAKSGNKNLNTHSFNCEKFEAEDPYASKGLDKDGLPVRAGISARGRKTTAPTGKQSAPSGISGLK